MESRYLNQKGMNKSSFLKKIILGSIFISALIYLIDSIKINIIKDKHLIRTLDEDVRLKGANENCMEIIGSFLYDLTELADLKKEEIDLGEGIEFKFCKNIGDKASSCVYNTETRLSGDINGEDNNKNKIEVEGKNVHLYLAAGDKCKSEPKKKYKIDVTLTCSDEKFKIYETNFNPETQCDLNFKAYTTHACGEDKYGEDSLEVRIMFGIVFIILGFLIGILGYKEIRIGLFIVCIVGAGTLGILIIGSFETFTLKVVHIVIESIFIICGIVIYVFFIKKDKKIYSRVYMLIIGGLCGYPIGLLIYNLLFAFIDTSYQQLIRTIIIVACIVIGVFLGIFFPKYTCIIGSSIIGAYLIMRGISSFLHEYVEFIEEFKLYDLAHSGNYEKISEMILGYFLIYPAILVIFIIIFIIVQIKLNPNWKESSYKDLNDMIKKPKDLSSLSFMGDAEGETP